MTPGPALLAGTLRGPSAAAVLIGAPDVAAKSCASVIVVDWMVTWSSPSGEVTVIVPAVVSDGSELLFEIPSASSPEPAGRPPCGGSPASNTSAPAAPAAGTVSDGVALPIAIVSVAWDRSPSPSFSV